MPFTSLNYPATYYPTDALRVTPARGTRPDLTAIGQRFRFVDLSEYAKILIPDSLVLIGESGEEVPVMGVYTTADNVINAKVGLLRSLPSDKAAYKEGPGDPASGFPINGLQDDVYVEALEDGLIHITLLGEYDVYSLPGEAQVRTISYMEAYARTVLDNSVQEPTPVLVGILGPAFDYPAGVTIRNPVVLARIPSDLLWRP